MVFSKTGSIESEGTDTWNVAADFSKLKIMKPLYFLDEYEVIATFGTSDIIEDFTVDEKSKTFARIKALERFVKMLQMVLGNSKFAVKPADRPGMETYLKQVKEIKDLLPMVQSRIVNQKTKTFELRIKEDAFTKLLDVLISIKNEINEPLNRANLIFRERDETSPDELKNRLMKEMTEGG